MISFLFSKLNSILFIALCLMSFINLNKNPKDFPEKSNSVFSLLTSKTLPNDPNPSFFIS